MRIFPQSVCGGGEGDWGDGIGTRGIRLQTNPKPQDLDREPNKPWGKKLGTSSVFSK